jgi:pimeloyl-ACP methyl ester carboxylesterase
VDELRFVEANGLRFAYFEEGVGPLVLMMHGFPDTAHSWDAARPAVARAGFRVVTPFTRGYHPTAIPADGAYDQLTLGRDVVALVEALGENAAIVVGHDWGAAAAYCAAGLAPERVRLLVTIGIPHPAGILPTPQILWAVRHFAVLRRAGAAARARRDDFAYIDELVQRWSPSWKVPPGETDAVKRSFAEPGALEAAVGYYRALSPRLPAPMRRKVEMPAVAFAGEDDTISPSHYERARARYLGSYEVVRMPGGHFMHREHPDVFVRELLRVLGPYARA